MDLIRPKDQAREVELELEDERFPEGKLIEVPEDFGLDLENFFQSLSAREQEVAKLLASGIEIIVYPNTSARMNPHQIEV